MMKRLLLILSMLIIPIFTLYSSAKAASSDGDSPVIRITIKASSDADYASQVTIHSPAWLNWLRQPSNSFAMKWLPISDAMLTIQQQDKDTSYVIDDHGFLYDLREHRQLRPPVPLRKQIIRTVQRLRSEHYGMMLPWNEIQALFPRYDIFTVMDLESGLSFNVQRRAGSSHADVQPLTRKDTYIMKQIYNGKWSWKRRAILVWHPLDSLNGQTYAASMHGMPHGGDGILNNAFSGHFCIHFLHSKTHGGNREDFDHHLMIYKAAGKLYEFYASATPEQLVHSFFSAINQQDATLLSGCFAAYNHPLLHFFKNEMKRIASAHFALRTTTEPPPSDPFDQSLVREITVHAELYRKQEGRVRQVFTFLLTREALHMPWTITQITLVS